MNEVQTATSYQSCDSAKSICSLLVALGIDKNRVYAAHSPFPSRYYKHYSFWERFADPYDLEELLQDAKKLFRQKCKQLRTDKTINHQEAVKVIEIWRRIQRICKWHGVIV